MRIFETRHGQVATTEYYNNDPSLPVRNAGLSSLGEEQALLLGKKLKALQFRGIIFSSPYARTMATASIIAKEVGGKIIPLPCLHEIVSCAEEITQGESAEELARKYPLAEIEETMPYPWWGEQVEEFSDVIARLKTGLKSVLEKLPKEIDVLLVGHAATSVALRHLFQCTAKNLNFHWNCHLSLLYAQGDELYVNDCTHLPENFWTGNRLLFAEQKKRFQESIEQATVVFQENSGQKVLHIGDTHSSEYSYYQKLIKAICPDIIIHTGDLADELKAGRKEGVRQYWKNSAQSMIEMMEKSGARVIIVAGNNDLEEEVKMMATRAEILPRNTVIEIAGQRVLLCHEINKMEESAYAQVFLYGHGLTGETRTPTSNEQNGKLYFNAVWGASLHNFKTGLHIVLPKVYV